MAPPNCAVKNCLTRRDRIRIPQFPENHRFYSFPRNAATRDVWLKASSKPDAPNWLNYRMCGRHFAPDDYQRDLQHELTGSRQKWLLKPGAVPTLFLSGNHTEGKWKDKGDVIEQNTVQYKVDNINKRSNPGKRIIKRTRAYSPDNYKSIPTSLPSSKRGKKQSVCTMSKGAKRQKISPTIKAENVKISDKLLEVFQNVIENKSSTCSQRSGRAQTYEHCKLEVMQETKNNRQHCQQQPRETEERIQEIEEQEIDNKQETATNTLNTYLVNGIKEEICYESDELNDQYFVGIKEEVQDFSYDSEAITCAGDFEGTTLACGTDDASLAASDKGSIKYEPGVDHDLGPGMGNQSSSLIKASAQGESGLRLLSDSLGNNYSLSMDGATEVGCSVPFISRGVEQYNASITKADYEHTNGVIDFVLVKEEPEITVEECCRQVKLELNGCTIESSNEDGKSTFSEAPFNKEGLLQEIRLDEKDPTFPISEQALITDKACYLQSNKGRDAEAHTVLAKNQPVIFDSATSIRFNVAPKPIISSCNISGPISSRSMLLEGTLLPSSALHQPFPSRGDATILHGNLSYPKALSIDSDAISMTSPVISRHSLPEKSLSNGASSSKRIKTTTDHNFTCNVNTVEQQVCGSSNINTSSMVSIVDSSSSTGSVSSLDLDYPQIVGVKVTPLAGLENIENVVKIEGTPFYDIKEIVKVEATCLSPEPDEVVKDERMELSRIEKNPHVSTLGSYTGKMYTCSKCSYATSNAKFLMIHSSSHVMSNSSNVGSVFRCSQCSYSTFNIDQFLKHDANHLAKRLTKHVVASSPSGRGDEGCVETSPEDTALPCPPEEWVLSGKASQNHSKNYLVKTISPNQPTSQPGCEDGMVPCQCFYHCFKCNYKTGNNRDFAHHQKYKHTEDPKSAAQTGHFSCAQCNHVSININEFLMHTKVHSMNNLTTETKSSLSSDLQICTLKGPQTSKVIFTKRFTKIAPKPNFGGAESRAKQLVTECSKEQVTEPLMIIAPKPNSGGAESRSKQLITECSKEQVTEPPMIIAPKPNSGGAESRAKQLITEYSKEQVTEPPMIIAPKPNSGGAESRAKQLITEYSKEQVTEPPMIIAPKPNSGGAESRAKQLITEGFKEQATKPPMIIAPKPNSGGAESRAEQLITEGFKEQATKPPMIIAPKPNSGGAESRAKQLITECFKEQATEPPMIIASKPNITETKNYSNAVRIESLKERVPKKLLKIDPESNSGDAENKASTVIHQGQVSAFFQSTKGEGQKCIDIVKFSDTPPPSNITLPHHLSASDIFKQTLVTSKSFHCRRCSFTAVDITDFLEHIKVHCEKTSKPQESEQCSKLKVLHCSFSTSKVKLYDQHCTFRTLKDNHEAPHKFYCRLCQTTSTDMASFLKHTECHTQPPSARFGCLECPFTSDILDDFLDHTRSHETACSPKRCERRFSCTMCPYSCDDIDEFLQHTSSHESMLSEYACKLCFLRFTTAALLKHHTMSCRVTGKAHASAQSAKKTAVKVGIKSLKVASKISSASPKQTPQGSKNSSKLIKSNNSKLFSKEVPTLDVTGQTLVQRNSVLPTSVSSNESSFVGELQYHGSKVNPIPDLVIENIQMSSILKSESSSKQTVKGKLFKDSLMDVLSDDENCDTLAESNNITNNIKQIPTKNATFLNSAGSQSMALQPVNLVEKNVIQKSVVSLVPGSQKTYFNPNIRSVSGSTLKKILIHRNNSDGTDVELKRGSKSDLGIKGEDSIVQPKCSYGIKRYKGVTCYTFAAFKCKICRFRCDTKTELNEHVSREHGIRCDPLPNRSSSLRFICPVCLTKKEFTSKTTLVAHAKTHMYRGKYACKHCDFKDDDDSILEAHSSDHWLEGRLVCRHCIALKKGQWQREVSHDSNTATSVGQRVSCGENCLSNKADGSVDEDTGQDENGGEDSTNEVNLPNEKDCKDPSDARKNNITQCRCSMSWLGAYRNKINDIKHRIIGSETTTSTAADSKDKSERGTEFICKPCKYKTICQTDYELHLVLHLGTSLKCRRCDFSTYSHKLYYEHYKTHPVNSVKCPHCPFSSFFQHNLKKHVASHTGEGVYSCCECKFTTTSQLVLTRHRASHTGVGMLECSHCDYKNPFKRQLKVHMKRHTGEGMYTCLECNFISSYKSIYKEHLRIHTNEKLYECPRVDCHFETPYNNSFIEHNKKHQMADKGLASTPRLRPSSRYSCEEKWTLLFAYVYAELVHKDKRLKKAACLHEIWSKRYPQKPSVVRQTLMRLANLAVVALKKDDELFLKVKEATAAMVQSDECPFTAPVPLIEHADKLKGLWNNACRKWRKGIKFRSVKKISVKDAQETEKMDDSVNETDSSKDDEAV